VYQDENTIIYSPIDLCRFMTSPFASWMERCVFELPESSYEPVGADPMTTLLQNKCEVSEAAFLQPVRDAGKTVVEIVGATADEKRVATEAAITRGVDVIAQAYLADVSFCGVADLLVKVPNSCHGKSRLGDFHYEVWTTNTSQPAKPYFVIQVCCLADLLNTIQGCYANEFVLVLGDNKVERLRVDDYRYYYQHLKAQFLACEAAFDAQVMPDPAASTDWGRWASVAQGVFEAQDHLNQVATMTRAQIKALKNSGIHTATQLAKLDVDYVAKISPVALQRLKAQSKMQVHTKVLKAQGLEQRPAFEILLPAAGEAKGLALLPPPCVRDVFCDLEGASVVDGGLAYLWGAIYFDAHGDREFKDFWAHNAQEEKQCFQAFITWVYERWQSDPTMHIYHYANQVITTCRKLMGRYGVCEFEMDQLLRHEVFVDLHTLVRHGVILGAPRYSLETLAHLYRPERQVDKDDGGANEHWREMPDGEASAEVLNRIRDDKQNDCESIQELVDWLRVQQTEHGISYVGKTDEVVEALPEEITEKIRLRDRLLALAEQARATEGDKADVIETLAWVLEFHRREEKPSWWRLFDRLGLTEMELTDDLDCVATCKRTDTPPFKPSERARTLVFEYAFDRNQDLKPPREGTEMWVLGEDGMTFSLHEIDMQRGLLCLKGKVEPPAVVTLIPNTIVRAAPIPEAVESVVTAFEMALVKGEWPENAIVDFLLRRSPRIKGHRGEALVVGNDAEGRLQEVIDLVLNLDHSYVCIQGPPGAGKTFTGKQVIAELVQQGFKVGICSNSHKAINNLLVGVAETCLERGLDVMCCCAKDTGPEIDELGIKVLKNNEIQNHIQSGCVIGTTAWGFARDDVAGAFDYLFVDEAGQVSLANLVGISRAASNLVLMGDQMQLGQPIQGTHPGMSGQSVLEYLLQEHATIPEDLGVFLGTTYRMHPNVNRFISDAIYEGRLKAALGNEKQVIAVPEGCDGVVDVEAGIVFVPVAHEGNVQASDEEALVVKQLTDELLGRMFTDKNGGQREISWDDFLFVAPYNYQVNTLQAVLGKDARVGSVDRFQGQEAPVVILSLATSDAAESPRGLSFLLDKQRLNVAISRAQSLAIVVANPTLIQNFNGSLRDMQLANLFARFVG